jgi:replicative DNA helicase
VARVPPHDLEAEKAVLSALLLDNAAIHAIYTEINPTIDAKICRCTGW